MVETAGKMVMFDGCYKAKINIGRKIPLYRHAV